MKEGKYAIIIKSVQISRASGSVKKRLLLMSEIIMSEAVCKKHSRERKAQQGKKSTVGKEKYSRGKKSTAGKEKYSRERKAQPGKKSSAGKSDSGNGN